MSSEPAAAPARDRRVDAPHVCHIIFRLDVGGLENGLVNLINHMPVNACRHSIVSLKPCTDFRARIRRPDVAVYEIGQREGKDLAAYLRVWRLLRRIRPDVVHTRNIGAIDMLLPAALAGVRLRVHSEHGLGITEVTGRNAKYNRLRRASRALVKQYISVSEDLASWLRDEIGIPSQRIRVICNGVDTLRFRPADRDEPPPRALLPAGFAPPGAVVVATIGRFDAVKDQATLVRAFARMIEMRPALRTRARLVLIGDGSLRPQLVELVQSLGLADIAWLPGFRDDIPALYRAFDVFVLPSLREGISNTLLEAMATGLPLVATRVGGTPSIVGDENALLVPPADPARMAEALVRYVEDKALRRAHGAAGRARAVRDHSLDAMVRAYLSVYAAPSLR